MAALLSKKNLSALGLFLAFALVFDSSGLAKESKNISVRKHQAASEKKSPEKKKAEAEAKESQPVEGTTPSGWPTIQTNALQAIVIDHKTGVVLLEKNGDELMHPSSMTKIMTAYLVFERLKSGHLSLESKLPISETAWRMGGSKMFVALNSEVSIQDLLKGVIIQSGNDACVALGEGISGSEIAFADEMTRKAREMGAVQTTFKNASGWPDPEHLTTARDLLLIARHLIDDFPEYYPMFKEKEFIYNNIRQHNRNPLLYRNVACDGIKTGHTESGGYGLVASSVNGDQRIVMVINGLPSDKARTEESLKLITWAMRTFGTYKLYEKGQLVDNAAVWLGAENELPLTVEKDCYITLPKAARKGMTVELKYEGPISAPISKGDVVGKLVISAPTLAQPIEVPLVAAVTIDKASFWKRIKDSLSYLIFGKA
jgi:D-alanyl-D-alanine carboxypeptidase (penicillin-binding protein 5/6)